MLKIHNIFIFMKPINHEQSLQTKLFQIVPLFTSQRGKSPAHLWRSLRYRMVELWCHFVGENLEES